MSSVVGPIDEDSWARLALEIVAPEVLAPADVSVGDRWLFFEPAAKDAVSTAETGRAVINDFVRLVRSEDISEVQSYARRFGPLGLGRGSAETPKVPWTERADRTAVEQPAQVREDRREWRRHAEEVRFLLQGIEVVLRIGKPFGAWAELNAGPILPEPLYKPRPAGAPVADEAQALARYVQAWLREGRLTPRLEYRGRLRLCFDGEGLVSVLAFELLHALGHPELVFTCDSCGNPYVAVGRRPSPSTSHYCPRDRDTGRWSKGQEKYRQKAAARKASPKPPPD